MKNVVLPGLLIEYLVIGSMALVWVRLLFPEFDIEKASALYIIAMAPGIYVIGMLVEFIAFSLVSFPSNYCIKSLIRRLVRNRKDLVAFCNKQPEEQKKGAGTSRRQIKIHIEAANMAEQIEMRSSRDRIARGSMVNLFIIFLLLDDSIKVTIFQHQIELHYLIFIAFVISFAMWCYFEQHSYGYELRLVDELEKRSRG